MPHGGGPVVALAAIEAILGGTQLARSGEGVPVGRANPRAVCADAPGSGQKVGVYYFYIFWWLMMMLSVYGGVDSTWDWGFFF